MKKLFVEHTENIPVCDMSGRIPKLKEWNSFSHPKKECDLQMHPVKIIGKLNEPLEKIKI